MTKKTNKFDSVRKKNPKIKRNAPCIVEGSACYVSNAESGAVIVRAYYRCHPADVKCELTPQDVKALALIDSLVLRADEHLIHEVLAGSGLEAYSDEAYAVRRHAQDLIRTLLRNYRRVPAQEPTP